MFNKMSIIDDLGLWNASVEFLNSRLSNNEKRYFLSPLKITSTIKLLKEGNYKFKPPTVKKVPKDDGGFREVLVLDNFDTLVMRVLTDIFSSIYKDRIDSSVYSYQEGLDTSVPIKKLQLSIHRGVKIDIKKYFDSVSIESILNTLNSLGSNGIIECLKEFYSDNRVIENGVVTERFKSIAQGISFSSFLANVILYEFDLKMKLRYREYIRYSDDMIVEIYDNQDYEEEVGYIKECLKEFGLKLNENKLTFYKDKVKFLGCIVEKGNISLTPERKKRIKGVIKKCKSGFKKRNRQEQEAYIIKTFNTLFNPNTFYGSGFNMFKVVTDVSDISEINKYFKQMVRSVYDGCNNYTRGVNLTSEEDLKELGYEDLVHLYFIYKDNPRAFKTHIRSKELSRRFKPSTDGIEILDIKLSDIEKLAEEVDKIDLTNNLIQLKNKEVYRVPKVVEFNEVENEIFKAYGMSEGSTWHSPLIHMKQNLSFRFGDEEYYDKLCCLYILISRMNLSRRYIIIKDMLLLKDWFS